MSAGITAAEWKLMELLWEEPHTLMELVHKLHQSEAWSKSTVTTMLRRMLDKGVIRFEEQGRTKIFYAVPRRSDVVALQTRSFLQRAYHGSIGLMVSAMSQHNDLSDEDIDELMQILREAKTR